MRLVDLSPWWITQRGERIGVMFLCPHCVQSKPTFVSCFWKSPPWTAGEDDNSQYGLFVRMLEEMGPDLARGIDANEVVPCTKGYNWGRIGDTFDTLSINPSIDASPAGHWHGHIKNGAIV